MLNKKVENIYLKKIESISENYNSDYGLLEEYMKDFGRGYHSRYQGIVHKTRENVEYAFYIIMGKYVELYDRANCIIEKICDIQDTRVESETFGLWPYYFDEPIDDMRAPDYNWADFISKILICAVYYGKGILNKEVLKKTQTAINNAVACSIKRDVAPDYTNISVMSAFCIVAAGEIFDRNDFIEVGRKRLERFLEYIEFNGTFSEYNSTGYTIITMEELSRITAVVKDTKTLEVAEKLLKYGWSIMFRNYNTSIRQHTPPYYRAYYDIDRRDEDQKDICLPSWLYCTTKGRYGYITSERQITFDTMFFCEKCPDEFLKLLEPVEERWIDEIFYKKNNFRQEGYEYCTISNYDCPDLRAFSYMTPLYSMGAFDVIDGWNQRRSSMVIWGKEEPCYIRIRPMNNGYDFCSGMVYTAQYKNAMLSHIGFVKDRGDFHFNLDKIKDGKIVTEDLCFKIEFGGADAVVQQKSDRTFVYTHENVIVKVDISSWIFDGRPGEIRYDEEEKSIYLICYAGEKKEIDLCSLKDTYGVIYIAANDESDVEIKTECSNEEVYTSVRRLYVKSPTNVISYSEALVNYQADNK